MTQELPELMTVTIRIPSELKAALDRVAEKQGGRSLSSLVRQILEDQVKEVKEEEVLP